MDHILTGISVFLISICTYFNGCHKESPHTVNSQIFKVKNSTYLSASQSSALKEIIRQKKTEGGISNGEKTFFGQVISIDKNSLTIQLPTSIKSSQKGAPIMSKYTVELNNSVQYSGGTFSDIQKGTRIAGIGKTLSDGKFLAIKIEIKTTAPTNEINP